MTSQIDNTPESSLLIQKAKNLMTQISMDALKYSKDNSTKDNFVVGNVAATIMGNCKKYKEFHANN